MRPPALPNTHTAASPLTALTTEQRRAAAITALGIVLVFGVAAILTPDTRGLGTHQQLGLPPCMTEAAFGVPCPFCGMTTAFAHMAHGHVAEAIAVQPAGALGFILSALLAVGLLAAGVTGAATAQWKAIRQSPWLYSLGGVVIVTAWVYKILSHLGVIQL